MTQLRITVAVDNTPGAPELIAEHGLALWIEHAGRHVLFDTGQGRALFHNAQPLGIALKETSTICLSHGHYDHTGGLAVALAQAHVPRLFVNPGAFAPKFAAKTDGEIRYIGIAQSDVPIVQKLSSVMWTNHPMPVIDDIYVTGPIPRVTAFEDVGGPFFTDREGAGADSLVDDQALYANTAAGIVVVLGCAHAGVVNTLLYIRKLTDNAPIHTVMGGMHLVSASHGRIDATVHALRQLNVQRLVPLHCTGTAAMARIRDEFPTHFVAGGVGTVLEW